MNKKLEWYIIIFLVIVLVGLSSCSPSPHVDKQSPHETEEEMNAEITKDMDAMDKEKELLNSDGPTNFEGIAHALACMFAPTECPANKSKEEKKLDR